MSESEPKRGFPRWAHGVILSVTAALTLLFPYRFSRILALDLEAYLYNQYQFYLLMPQEWADWGRLAVRYAAVPYALLLIAALIYKASARVWSAENPLAAIPRRTARWMGAAVLAPVLAASWLYAQALSMWLAVEAFWWIEWYAAIYPTMEQILYSGPIFVTPGIVTFSILFLLWAWPRAAVDERHSFVLRALRGAFVVIALPFLAAVLAGSTHAARVYTAPGIDTFENRCEQCHARSQPLYYIKTPAEWRRTVDRMANYNLPPLYEGPEDAVLPFTQTEKEEALLFVTAMRSFSDRWTFITRCVRCHTVDRFGWENRRPEDWARITGRIARWSPYYYRPDVRDQIVHHLTATYSDSEATHGLDREQYERWMRLEARCASCHSLSLEADRYRKASAKELDDMVARMEERMTTPLTDRERTEIVQSYKEAIADPDVFDRVFPHDRPTEGETAP
ncbi:MAG: hypothetical protein M5R36_04340 [Deltaproteobacteria bacterium]|nr:hypothetical protein [Deltaproteobacteria bacterium]